MQKDYIIYNWKNPLELYTVQSKGVLYHNKPQHTHASPKQHAQQQLNENWMDFASEQ